MGISLIDFDGFESGGPEGLAVNNGCTATDSISPWSPKEDYVLFIPNTVGQTKGYFESAFAFVNNTEWLSMAFWGQWSRMDRKVDLIYEFFRANYSNPHFKLECVTTSTTRAKIRLINALGATIGTTADDVMFADQWFLLEMKWNRSTTGDIKIWINGQIIFDETGVDIDNGTTVVSLSVANRSSSITDTNLYVGSYYFRTDDGENINTNNTLLGNFTVLGAWKTNQTGTVPDFGDTLDGGTWPNTENVPQNDTHTAHYSTAIGGANKAGGISKDRATTGGPKNDADRDGTIRGGKWIWSWKGPPAGMFGGAPKWEGKYGAHTNPATDNMLSTGFIQGNNNWKNKFIVSDTMSGTGRVPQNNDHAQIGFGIQGEENAGAVYVADMWVFILHEEIVSQKLKGIILPQGIIPFVRA